MATLTGTATGTSHGAAKVEARPAERAEGSEKLPARGTGRVSLPCAPLDQHVTLLELVEAVSSVTDDDDEVVATVSHMLRSGTVTLSGNFRGQTILGAGPKR